MDIFSNLPDELLIKTCNELPTPDLLNASVASSRILQVCDEIIKQRKKEYEISRLIDKVNQGKVLHVNINNVPYNIVESLIKDTGVDLYTLKSNYEGYTDYLLSHGKSNPDYEIVIHKGSFSNNLNITFSIHQHNLSFYTGFNLSWSVSLENIKTILERIQDNELLDRITF